MNGITVEFLVGLYFFVQELPNLATPGTRSQASIVRFVLAVILIALSMFGISLIG